MREFVISENGKPKKSAIGNAQAYAAAVWGRAVNGPATAMFVHVHGRGMKAFQFGHDGEP